MHAKKSLFVVSMLLFPCLVSLCQAELVGVWKMDETSGNIAKDSSTNHNHGTVGGTAAWAAGVHGGALVFNGSDTYVDLPISNLMPTLDNATLAVWVLNQNAGQWSRVIDFGTNTANYLYVTSADSGNVVHVAITNGTWYESAGTAMPQNEWQHIAVTLDRQNQLVTLFQDGEPTASFTSPLMLADLGNTTNNWLGRSEYTADPLFTGREDDFVIYNEVLSQNAINELMQNGSPSPEIAGIVSPTDGETDVALDEVLQWKPGVYAGTHDVYFGTNFDDVNDASRANPNSVLVSQGQSGTTYTPAGLELDGAYYWRVDEVNATSDHYIYKGQVWSFQAEPTYFQEVPVGVTASSNGGEGYDPNNTINESGLTNDLHGTDSAEGANPVGNMWKTADGDVAGAWIQYEFKGPQQIGNMLVWNANPAYESILGVGIKEATIETSLDGQTWTDLAGTLTFNRATGKAGYAANTTIDFGGRVATYVRINVLSHWADLTPTVGLSEVRFMVIPTAARRPEPASGGTLASLTDPLVWRTGRGAEQHQLYIDTNETLVAAGDPSALVSTQTERRYNLGNTNLLYAEKYYWKVVELSGDSAVDGPVWDFNTPPYLVVDNMDSYNDNEGTRIFDSWADGYGPNDNGSVVGYGTAPFSETSIIFGGTQSMPYTYENTGGVTQASADLDLGDQNWSRGGAQTLVLYFLGERGNDNATLYISVDGHRVNSASPLNLGLWTQMNVDLGSLGINLSNVQTLTIGVNGAGTGLLYIDEIRVYREAPPIVVPTDPGSNGLVLHYEMENSVADTSGSGLNGTAQGSPVYVDSLSGLGQALEFDGVEDYVEVPIGNKITGWSDSTFSIWVNINPDNTTSNWMRAFDFGSADTTNLFLCPRTGTNGAVRTAIRVPSKNNGNEVGVTSSATLSDGWHHVACVFDNDANTLTLYVDGWSAGSVETDIRPMDLGVTTNNWLGQSQYDADSLYDGLLDEFRIYNRALSAGEVRYLAGDH